MLIDIRVQVASPFCQSLHLFHMLSPYRLVVILKRPLLIPPDSNEIRPNLIGPNP